LGGYTASSERQQIGRYGISAQIKRPNRHERRAILNGREVRGIPGIGS
jgi:hypothetical protein